MHVKRSLVAALAGVAVAGWIAVGSGQGIPTGILPGPYLASGDAIYPAFEGWGPLEDGANAALIGYYNRNKDQELDIPIGPSNHFDGATADLGQPTHFLTGRQWGVFAARFPANVSTTNRLTWTLVANGQTSTVSFWNNPPYWVDFFKFAATGNTPPHISFSSSDKGHWGPVLEPVAQTYEVGVNKALDLTVFVTDLGNTYDPYEGLGGAAVANANAGRGRGGRGGRGGAAGLLGRGRGAPTDVTLEWSKYRGPGWVSIDDPSLSLSKKREDGKVVDESEVMQAKTEAWFDAPGEYWLMAQAKDDSSTRGGGDQCCWSTTHVKVTVK